MVLLVCSLLPSTALAQRKAEGVEIASVRFGFDGVSKVGYFTPVVVTLQSDQAREVTVRVTVPDADSVPTVVTAVGRLQAGQKTSISLVTKLGQRRGGAVVELFDADGRPLGRRVLDRIDHVLASDAELLLVVGARLPADLESPYSRPEGSRTITLRGADGLPTDWLGYEGVDAVVITTSNADLVRGISKPRLDALEMWVRMGGKLLVFAGANAASLFGAEGNLARFSPGELAGAATLRDLTALESYVLGDEGGDPAAQLAMEEFRLEVPRFRNPRGLIEVSEGSGPQRVVLVARSPLGFGQVIFTAMDIDQPPLAKWGARERFFELLLARSTSLSSESAGGGRGEVTTLGYTDLAGQLYAALEQFEGVRAVPFALVAGIVVVYLACIGPLDYFLLRRWLGRMEFTWITFPLMVVLFSIAAPVLAYRFKGTDVLVKQLDVVDVDAESQLMRGTSWARIFSPGTAAYNLAFRPAPLGGASLPSESAEDEAAQTGDTPPVANRPRAVISWMALPGAGFGGMDASVETTPLFDAPYRYRADLSSLEGMPIAVWSTKGVAGRWHARATSLVSAELTDQGDDVLAGTIANDLPFALEKCALIYGRWVYPIGRFEPGRVIGIEGELEQQTADTFFRRVTVRSERDLTAPYDRASTDVTRIAEMMMFHDWAGGQKYTGLSNQYQHFLDASQLLRTGRAVLVGRGPAPATPLTSDGKPLATREEAVAFYRFVYPVKDAGRP